MHAWWISWYSPDATLNEFELHSPWWVSGYSDDATIIVAAVLAADESAAWEVIANAYDSPTSFQRRFCDPLDGVPFADRWPKAAWMDWDPENGVTCACGCEATP